jgi:hypothetical protein
MADDLEGSAASGRSRIAKPKPVTAKAAPAKPKRKSEPPMTADDLTGKFLRVGNKLYRTSDDTTPIVRIAGDRLKTSNIDALPDIIRIAKANGWTSIKVGGGDKFKKAAYLAAAAQGLEVENYRPSKIVKELPNARSAEMLKKLAQSPQRPKMNQSTSKLFRSGS